MMRINKQEVRNNLIDLSSFLSIQYIKPFKYLKGFF